MKKKSGENKSKAIENNSNGGFSTKEDCSAALLLASLKHQKLDKETAVTLDNLKKTFLRPSKGKDKQEEEDSSFQEEPRSVIHGSNRNLVSNSTIFDDHQPPDIPPIAALAGLIGECSRPYEKRLTESDLNDDAIMLSLDKNHVQEFMKPLLKEDEDVNKGIPMITYDSEGKEYSMKFVFCTLYVLTTVGWKKFYREHGPGERYR